MKRSILLIAISLLCLSTAPVFAAGFARVGTFAFSWEPFEADAGSESLAGTDLALADGPAAQYFNAAPLPSGATFQTSYSHKEWPADLGLRYCSVAVEREGWRLGFTRAEIYDDGMLRTAYDPEGTPIDTSHRIMVLGLSYDLARLVAPDSDAWRWTVGGNFRDYHSRLGESVMESNSGDFGSTLDRRWHLPRGWVGATAAVTARNLIGGRFEYDGQTAHLFEHLRCGLAVQGVLLNEDDSRLSAGLRLAYMHIQNIGPDSGDYQETNNWGVEAMACDLLTLRLGHRGRSSGIERGRWGLGLRTPQWLVSGWGVSVDYGNLDVWLAEDLNHWTFSGWLDL